MRRGGEVVGGGGGLYGPTISVEVILGEVRFRKELLLPLSAAVWQEQIELRRPELRWLVLSGLWPLFENWKMFLMLLFKCSLHISPLPTWQFSEMPKKNKHIYMKPSSKMFPFACRRCKQLKAMQYRCQAWCGTASLLLKDRKGRTTIPPGAWRVYRSCSSAHVIRHKLF